MGKINIIRKKAQMEVMGLAIIVILISVGVLLVIQFSLNDNEKSSLESYSKTQLDANLLNALMRTTAIDCNNRLLTSIFEDCASNPSSPRIYCKGGFTPSCVYLEETLNEIFDSTLVAWKKDFEFEATKTNILIKHGACTGNIERRQQPLPTDRGTMHIKLAICDKS